MSNKAINSDEICRDTAKLDIEIKRILYELYTAIFKAKISFNKKCHMLDAMYRGEPWAWKIVGITKEAYESMKISGSKGIHRHHNKKARKETYTSMFEQSLGEPLSLEQWWDLFDEGNEVILVTKEQNDKRKAVEEDKIIPLDNLEGRLFLNGMVGFRFTSEERNYLNKIIEELIYE